LADRTRELLAELVKLRSAWESRIVEVRTGDLTTTLFVNFGEIAAVKASKPGLILADIQLADGSSGLEAVNQILESFSVPVIFITAYPERFLTGTPPEPAFLITKPFSVDSLKAVISQALFFDRRSHRKDEPEARDAMA